MFRYSPIDLNSHFPSAASLRAHGLLTSQENIQWMKGIYHKEQKVACCVYTAGLSCAGLELIALGQMLPVSAVTAISGIILPPLGASLAREVPGDIEKRTKIHTLEKIIKELSDEGLVLSDEEKNCLQNRIAEVFQQTILNELTATS